MSPPYIVDENRLADVVSAIQTLGTYRFFKMTPREWSERINGDASQLNRWEKVFKDHPEFFRFTSDGSKVSLVLRKQKPKLFDVDKLTIVTREDRDSRSSDGQSRISRAPLEIDEMQMLIDVAVNLHTKALLQKQDRRWWAPIATGLLSALIGLGGVWLGATLDNETVGLANKNTPPQIEQAEEIGN